MQVAQVCSSGDGVYSKSDERIIGRRSHYPCVGVELVLMHVEAQAIQNGMYGRQAQIHSYHSS
jgi:hypothetical protein